MSLSPTITLTASSAEGEATVEVPAQLGSVRVLEPIGRGGMGAVFLGRDDALRRDVAVKFLHGSGAVLDSESINRFLEGARAAAQVKHLHLTTIYHADQVAGVPYLVMEFVRGQTIEAILSRRSSLSLMQVIAIMDSVCDAVSALHDAGILHLDLKPSNILVDTSGRTCVTDFGLTLPRSVATADGCHTLAGTPGYMAPEMFDRVLSPRTDVYALGVTTYQLIAGELPFRGAVADLVEQHRAAPVPVEILNQRKVPKGLIDLIERAMHKQAIFRHKSARQFRAHLRTAGEGMSPKGFAMMDLAELLSTTDSKSGHEPDPEFPRETPPINVSLSTLAETKRRMRPAIAAHSRTHEEEKPSISSDRLRLLTRQYPELMMFSGYSEQVQALKSIMESRQGRLWNLVRRRAEYLNISFEMVILGSFLLLLGCVLLPFSGLKLRGLFFVIFKTLLHTAPVVIGGCVSVLYLVTRPNQVRRQLRASLMDAGKLICVDCGYDLRDISAPRCPECGKGIANDQYDFQLRAEDDAGEFETRVNISGPSINYARARLTRECESLGFSAWTIRTECCSGSSSQRPGVLTMGPFQYSITGGDSSASISREGNDAVRSDDRNDDAKCKRRGFLAVGGIFLIALFDLFLCIRVFVIGPVKTPSQPIQRDFPVVKYMRSATSQPDLKVRTIRLPDGREIRIREKE